MIERLTGQDLWMFAPDEFGWPQDIGAVGVLDGGSPLAPDDAVLLDQVRAHIDRRVHLAPRLRQVVYRPGLGLGRPVWVDAASFAIADHVRSRTLGSPANEADLLRTCEELRRQPLDSSRPLWVLWLLPGLADGRIGVYFRLHHAIADGVAGVATIGALLDLSTDAPPPAASPWVPAPIPSRDELRADTWRRWRRAAARAIPWLARRLRTIGAARREWSPVPDLVVGDPGPSTSLNRRIGRDRRLALVRTDLETVTDVAHAHGATVNDVILAAVAGGLGDLLQARGERVGGLVLRAAVPVSLHHDVAHEPANLDAMMVVPLPVGELDLARRVELIAAETIEQKRRVRSNPFTYVMGVRRFQRFAMRVWVRQRVVNVYVANVPGPPAPMYLAGMPMVEVFPIVPLGGNVTIGVGVLSYAGRLNLTIVADRDGCADVEVFTNGLRRDLDAILRSGCELAS